MNRRTLILSLSALALVPRAAAAAPIPLADLSAYLNGLRAVETDFTQVNADGSVSTGRLYLRRPNRVRFEYAPPDRSLVLASAGSVAIFDPKSNQPPEQYPLNRTPLNLILARNVDLGRARMVVGHSEVEGTTRVLARDPDNPDYGTIELVFTPGPTTLRQWVITDDAGNQTTVILGDLVARDDMPDSLFDITREAERRRG